MRLITLLILVSLFCLPVYAQSISSLSGNAVHDTDISISGSSFGSKSPAAPIKWENFEDNSIDGDWTYEFSQQANASVVSTKNRGVSNYECEWNIYNTGNANFSWISGVAAQSEIYIYYYARRYWTFPDNGDTAYGLLKVNRVVTGSGSIPNWYYGWVYTDDIKAALEHVPDVGEVQGGYFPYDRETYFPNDTWVNFESYYKFGSAGASFQNVNCDQVYSYTGVNVITGETVYNTAYGFGIGFARVRSTGKLETDRYWIDDIYIDNTKARVMLGDNATFANCTHREIQIPHTWSDTSIGVTVNTGSFNNGDGVYLFVVDSDGTASEGYPVQIGEAVVGGGDSNTKGVYIT